MKILNTILRLAAQTLSYVFYPLFVPSYGMVLFCLSLSTVEGDSLPLASWLVCVGTTFVLTALIPLTAIMIRLRRGKITDLYITNPEQRTVPYLYATLGFSFWVYFMVAVLHAPVYINLVVLGATMALLGVMLINRWRKISAHLTAMGGLVGGVMSHYLMGNGGGIGLPVVLMVLALLLMYARIYLNAHTPLQVIAGFLLGLVLTLVPNCLLSYVV